MTNIRSILRFFVILVICFAVTAPIAPRLAAGDCDGVDHIDDPPCTPCPIVRIVDASGPCYGYGHYEDSCTQEIIGYWFYVC